MGSFFVWVSAERAILRAFRNQEVTRELYLASECSSQRRYRGCRKDRWWDRVLGVRFGGLGLDQMQRVCCWGGWGDGSGGVELGRPFMYRSRGEPLSRSRELGGPL